MTVTRSASGTRIDCDHCKDYAAAPRLGVDVLRRATGYVREGDRDYCPACWERRTVRRYASRGAAPTRDGPSAA